MPLRFNLYTVYQLPFFASNWTSDSWLWFSPTNRLWQEWASAAPWQRAEHKASPAFPPPHPCTQQNNICTAVHNPQTKKQQEHYKNKQLLSVGSLCLKLTASHTQACGGMLLCLGEPSSLLYSLPSAVFLSSVSLSLTCGPVVSISEKGLDINV